MHTMPDLLASHPGKHDVDLDVLVACLTACVECATACTACADACLDEDGVADMVRCIRSDQDCADVCAATAALLARRPVDTTLLVSMLEACSTACGVCAAECERHADHHEHCRLCAEACRACERACRDLLGALGKAG